MSKVIPESELEAAKKSITEGVKKLQNSITALDGYVQLLPDALGNLEVALQTEGGHYITSDVSNSIEEIRQILDKLKKTSANIVENIRHGQKKHTEKKIGEKKLGGGEIN